MKWRASNCRWLGRETATEISGKGLRGGRSARRAMQRERIQRRSVFRKDRVPGDLPCFGDQVQRRSCQCRHVQGLANRAGSFRPTGVLMDKGAATGEIQQRHATQ